MKRTPRTWTEVGELGRYVIAIRAILPRGKYPLSKIAALVGVSHSAARHYVCENGERIKSIRQR